MAPAPSSDWTIHALDASANALEAFESERPQTGRPGGATAATTSAPASDKPPVSLASLKLAGIQLNGDEAVAIGQALCRAFMTAQLLRRVTPENDPTGALTPVNSDTVFIDAASRVGVSVAIPRDVPTAIYAIGRVLSDILPANTRLFIQTSIISKALASPPQFGTVDELSQALTSYEPRSGQDLIQAVYDRWEKRRLDGPPAVAAALTAKTPDLPAAAPRRAVAPTSVLAGSKPLAKSASAPQAAAVVAALTVGAVAAIGGGAWFLLNRGKTAHEKPPLDTKPIARMMYAELPDVTPAWVYKEELASSPAARASSARTESPAAPPTTAAVRGARPLSAPSRPAQPAASAAPAAVAGVETEPAGPRATASVAARSTPPAAVAPSTTQTTKIANGSSSSGNPSEPIAAQPVYDARYVDVVPPAPIQPRLLAGLRASSPGVRVDALVIAVVVNSDGTTFSVSAVNPPQTMSESVLLTSALSVVKEWRFTPAIKDGGPVRYRLIVPLSALTAK